MYRLDSTRRFVRVVLSLGLLALCCLEANAQAVLTYNRDSQSATTQKTSPQQLSVNVKQVNHQADVQASLPQPADSHRRLAPPSRQKLAPPSSGQNNRSTQGQSFALPQIESFATAGAGLAIVIGLFLVCMWLLRRNGPKPSSPLPREAVSVLGRVPLAARNFAHLLHVGNKLVLVAITPEGVSPITEVTDPTEVQRMLGLCQSHGQQSTTAEFQNVLQQIAKEPAKGFLGNEVAASYTNQRR